MEGVKRSALFTGIILAACFTFFDGCFAVNIRNLKVPPLVELDTGDAVVLDCEYTFDNKDGLVVKWFFNKLNYPVYQWIPPLKPQDLGMLKGKVDLGYTVSDDPYHSHRALRILKPTADMSGNYSCVVSTFDDEDYKSKTMLMFTPGKNFQLKQEKVDASSVKLVCFAEDVYPKPTISITSKSNIILEVSTDSMPSSDGLYDVVSTVIVKDADLGDSEEFLCEMKIPQTKYEARRGTTYYPGVMPTAQLAAASGGALEDQRIGSGAMHLHTNSAVLITIIAALFYTSSLIKDVLL